MSRPPANRASYEEAKKLISSLSSPPTSLSEYKKMFDENILPVGLPKDPYYYKGKGFISLGDFLGTNSVAPQYRTWESYESAKNLLSTLKQPPRSGKEYLKLYKQGGIPNKIPMYPDNTYRNNGWVSWGDFLGTGVIANQNKDFVSYDEAKAIIQDLPVRPTTSKEYRELHKKKSIPHSLPHNAPHVYKNSGWDGWGDYLGTGNIAPQNKIFVDYEVAKSIIAEMEAPPSSQVEYFQYARNNLLPDGVPHSPSDVYGEKFLGYQDYLGLFKLQSLSRAELRIRAELETIFGTGEVIRFSDRRSKIQELDIYVPAHKIAIEYDGSFWHKNNLKRDKEKNKAALEQGITIFRIREQVSSRGLNLPLISDPHDVTHEAKSSLLVTIQRLLGKIKRHLYQELNFSSLKKLTEYESLTNFANPARYKELLIENRDRWLTYEEAKNAINESQKSPINHREFKQLAQRGELPARVPNDPYSVYKDTGWISWGDFLSTDTVATYNIQFADFFEARNYLIKLGVNRPKNRKAYEELVRNGEIDIQLPLDPYNTYSKHPEWQGLPHFLGEELEPIAFVDIETARQMLRNLDHKITSQNEYKLASKAGKLPKGLPSSPHDYYKDTGWLGWYHFLGTTKSDHAHVSNFVSYDEAKQLVQNLDPLPNTYTEYRALAKMGMLPDELPKDPYAAYKGNGWMGVKDFLGR